MDCRPYPQHRRHPRPLQPLLGGTLIRLSPFLFSQSSMAATILSIEGIRKSFGSLHALDGVSLDVEEGKISILIGPNGSGKTTLINVISGLYKPDSGRTFFKGQDITSLAPY